MARLDVASSNVRGGFFPNIGSTGSDTGRYQGAIAVKAVPFPNVARRSQFFFPPFGAGPARRERRICVACFVSFDSVTRGHVVRRVSPRMIRDQRSGRAPALIAPTDSIDLSESAISRGSRRQRKAGRPRTAGSLRADQRVLQPCRPPKSQIKRMIGIGIPISHSNRPRPIFASSAISTATRTSALNESSTAARDFAFVHGLAQQARSASGARVNLSSPIID